MGFWNALAEGSVTGLFKGVGEFAKDMRTAITGEEPLNSEQKAEILQRLDAMEAAAEQREHETVMGQQELTKIEAQSPSLFKSGWRPALGWACVAGIAYQFVFAPVCSWLIKVGFLVYALISNVGMTGALKTLMEEAVTLPALDMETLVGLIITLLGAGSWRMLEKKWGVASR